jgi:hypothetical protein
MLGERERKEEKNDKKGKKRGSRISGSVVIKSE